MGQKVHPIGFRIGGGFRSWSSRWFAKVNKNSYARQVFEDLKIRQYIKKHLGFAEIADVEIEKTGETARIILHSARPGVVIGKKGQDIEALRKDLSDLLKRGSVEVSVQEVKNPELNATLVAKNIAEQLEKRVSFKGAMKKAVMSTLKAGARGIKICCSGRLGGAEIARSEWERSGSVPLHTLRSDVDYGFEEARTTYGVIGVKVWICRGEYKKD